MKVRLICTCMSCDFEFYNHTQDWDFKLIIVSKRCPICGSSKNQVEVLK